MLKLTSLLFLVSSLTSSFGQTPAVFMDGLVSTNLSERDMAIAPDGSEMFYTLQSSQHVISTIIRRKKISGNKWSAPEVASFSGMFSDLEPAFSPDGNKLFFSSNRALNGNGTKDFDIWVSQKVKEGWTTPVNLGPPVNTSGNEFYPSVALSGTLYYTAEYEHGVGKEDIFYSNFLNGSYTPPVALDTAVNSKLWEFNAFVSPDESMILFTSYGRKDDQGGGDLYISQKKDGKWQPAINLKSINSPQIDYCPFVHDGKIYFTSGRHNISKYNPKPLKFEELARSYNGTSNGSEDIFWVDLTSVLEANH